MNAQIRFCIVLYVNDTTRERLSRTVVVVQHSDFQGLMRGINDAVARKLGMPNGEVVRLTNSYGNVIHERSYANGIMAECDLLTALVDTPNPPPLGPHRA